jgi:hypothetical protein
MLLLRAAAGWNPSSIEDRFKSSVIIPGFTLTGLLHKSLVWFPRYPLATKINKEIWPTFSTFHYYNIACDFASSFPLALHSICERGASVFTRILPIGKPHIPTKSRIPIELAAIDG